MPAAGRQDFALARRWKVRAAPAGVAERGFAARAAEQARSAPASEARQEFAWRRSTTEHTLPGAEACAAPAAAAGFTIPASRGDTEAAGAAAEGILAGTILVACRAPLFTARSSWEASRPRSVAGEIASS